ncbi:hypothetical protein PHSY_002590 [Pseudozyma hubeiensis SY62]|uniref:Transmembrane protein n=1 Tax=Pseudozyma hubeiensis (strain SY62) TaxID=1305764 RepID=R9PA98_PSEHS|nr:hypothetical protein PHSY_002590 [Pseudozyma hubeiensis SY62]GAC95015.1 hypothetical protein PHSY_002590 [Pseudozyma hubeiensis SY62]
MPFQLSPASLVDQRASDYPSLLLLPDSALPLAAQAFGNFSANVPINVAVPQIFVVNPTSDNIFRHVDSENAHAAIIGLIYFSMWMGALGWDIVSTVPFDVRVVKETTWSSSFSSIYSIAYLLSRYVSLSWLITAVTNSVIMTNQCDAWMKGSTALFSVGISATMLVFCLRTCSIWHMRQKVVSLVVSAWFLVVAFAVLLPVMSNGSQLPTSNFCSWHFNGLYVVGVFGALLVFDLLCLVLTVCKLNKAGWRGLIRSLFPSGRHNLDAEDVKTMLVQKTTAFFAIQFLFLISALLVYVLTDTYAYRMMNIVASVAVASSMAGRIFRRAWRQTRELAPHNLNRPPSYYPAWAEEHPEATFSRSDVHSVYTPSDQPAAGGHPEAGAMVAARARRHHDKHDSFAFYVEGEFRPQNKARSMSSPSLRSIPRTLSSTTATNQMREMEAGHAAAEPGSDVLSMVPGTMVIARNNLAVPISDSTRAMRRDSSASQGVPAPAYSRRLGSASSSRPHTGGSDAPACAARRPTSANGQNSPRRGVYPSMPNIQLPASTVAPQPHSSNLFSGLPASSFHDIADAQLAAGPRNHHEDSNGKQAQQETVMEERRRTFVTSPPLSAGVRLNSKEVYNVDNVKAAARLGPRQKHIHKALARPATASSVPLAPALELSGWRGSARTETDPTRRGATADAIGSAEPSSPPSLGEASPASDQQRTPRPKTAPSWPSPSLSATGSAASDVTVLPRAFGKPAPSSQAHPGASDADHTPFVTTGTDDDALLAFLDTVEQDSRDRAGCHPTAPPAAFANALATDDTRPRTSRGNTATSSGSFDADEGKELQLSPGAQLQVDARGRRASASASAQMRSGMSSRDGQGCQTRASTSAGAKGRPGTSEGGSSAHRPSTAIGESVKPFGFGTSGSAPRRGSRAQTAGAISDDEEGEANAELGSVIRNEYAKLAARAQMPLDPPC